jgi:hypothetical protein
MTTKTCAWRRWLPTTKAIQPIKSLERHPRFLIHDSPREGEVITTFFRRIFQAAIWMQSLTNTEPTFQYIVTTADAPPEYAVANVNPTCLVLSGTDRLLKRRY